MVVSRRPGSPNDHIPPWMFWVSSLLKMLSSHCFKSLLSARTHHHQAIQFYFNEKKCIFVFPVKVSWISLWACLATELTVFSLRTQMNSCMDQFTLHRTTWTAAEQKLPSKVLHESMAYNNSKRSFGPEIRSCYAHPQVVPLFSQGEMGSGRSLQSREQNLIASL